MSSRRDFLKTSSLLAAAGPVRARVAENPDLSGERASLDGLWQFRLDPRGAGIPEKWHLPGTPVQGWRGVRVPHTWQIEPEFAGYMGVGWYRRAFDVPADWAESAVRVEFEAVFHSAEVWVNGKPAGSHTGKGYTAFALDVTSLVRFGARNFKIGRAHV